MTGATGFVGGAVARRLAADGHVVRALVRSPERAHDLARLGVEIHPGDITNKASLRAPMTGVDAVMHIAAWYKLGVPGGSAEARAVNVDGTRHVLETMTELGVPKGVYTSTIAIYSDTRGRVVDETTRRYDGPYLSRYEATKAEAHRVAESFIAAGLPLVVVLPGAVYGPGDTSALATLWRRLLARNLPPLPARTAQCWGFIDDIAAGHTLALEKGRPGRSYILAGPAHTLAEAVEMAAHLTGIQPPRRYLPPWVLKAAAHMTGPLGALVRLPSEFTPEALRTLAGVTYLGSGMRARRELGWRARPLLDGLAETLRS